LPTEAGVLIRVVLEPVDLFQDRMTGNCCTMIVCSLSMIECCVAELVVEPYWFNSASTAGLEKRSQFDGAGEPIAAEFFEYNHWRIS